MKRLPVAMLICSLALAIPWPAVARTSAVTGCSYNPSDHSVNVSIEGTVSQTVISRGVDGHILLDDVWCANLATVTNTDVILVGGDEGDQNVLVRLDNKGFKPGFTNEAGKSDEIEFIVDLGGGSSDVFAIFGTSANDKIDLGERVHQVLGRTTRINLNAGESTGIDADVVVFSTTEEFRVFAADGDNRVRSSGKAGTGPDKLSTLLRAYGGTGDDLLKGGTAADFLDGGDGVDLIYGGAGMDTIKLNDGTPGDEAFTGPGADTCVADPGDICHD